MLLFQLGFPDVFLVNRRFRLIIRMRRNCDFDKQLDIKYRAYMFHILKRLKISLEDDDDDDDDENIASHNASHRESTLC